MNVVCPACERSSPLSDFRLEAGTLVVRCAQCGVETRVTPGEKPPVTPSGVEGPPVTLSGVEGPPVTLSGVEGRTTSALDSARAERGVGRDRSAALDSARAERVVGAGVERAPDPFVVPSGHCIKCISPVKPGAVSCPGCGLTFARFDAASVEAPADLKARWLALVQRADADEGAHEAFRRSLDADGLVALGRLYRIQLARNPEDLLARRGRERVLELAVERAAAIPVAPPPSTRTLKNVLAVVVILACIAAVAAFIPFVVRSLRS